mmetsp:Transcript_47164/g.106884  ORF Transcript_47164/g.106884 Transcript_47164/m.106884 type:complete len:233 (-) Transcript_47164:80-778(-)
MGTLEILSENVANIVRVQAISHWEAQLIDSSFYDVFEGVPLTIDGTASLTYGELTLSSLRKVLGVVRQFYGGELASGDGLFVDLGSGFGRLCIAMALEQGALAEGFASILGIEINDQLHDASMGALRRLYSHSTADFFMRGRSVTLLCADATACPEAWCNADLLYICCTCFDAPLINALTKLIDKYLKDGSLVITVSRRLPVPSLETLEVFSAECTWGHAEIFLGRKKPMPR